jgi:hypothetical protein
LLGTVNTGGGGGELVEGGGIGVVVIVVVVITVGGGDSGGGDSGGGGGSTVVVVGGGETAIGGETVVVAGRVVEIGGGGGRRGAVTVPAVGASGEVERVVGPETPRVVVVAEAGCMIATGAAPVPLVVAAGASRASIAPAVIWVAEADAGFTAAGWVAVDAGLPPEPPGCGEVGETVAADAAGGDAPALWRGAASRLSSCWLIVLAVGLA